MRMYLEKHEKHEKDEKRKEQMDTKTVEMGKGTYDLSSV